MQRGENVEECLPPTSECWSRACSPQPVSALLWTQLVESPRFFFPQESFMVELEALLVRVLGFVRLAAKFGFMVNSVLSQHGLQIHHTHQHIHYTHYTVHGYYHCPNRGGQLTSRLLQGLKL